MHGFVIIREPRSGCEQARLKLFQFNQLLVLFVGVTDSGQVATLPGQILKEIVTWSSVSCEEYSAANRPCL